MRPLVWLSEVGSKTEQNPIETHSKVPNKIKFVYGTKKIYFNRDYPHDNCTGVKFYVTNQMKFYRGAKL